MVKDKRNRPAQRVRDGQILAVMDEEVIEDELEKPRKEYQRAILLPRGKDL